MDTTMVSELHNKRGLVYMGDFLDSLSEDQLNAGYIKFNIPNEDSLDSPNGEGVWGWVTPEDKLLFNNDSFYGNISAILCNTPFNFGGTLFWGTEVVLQCRGSARPTISKDWVEKHILESEWFEKYNQ